MKRLALSMAIAALALVASPMLTGCASAESFVQSLTTATPAQASTVKAAGDIYVLVDKAATAYLNSGKATKAVERQMVPIEQQVHDALLAAQAADAKGDSAAAGAALSIFNANYAKLFALVPGMPSSS